MKRKHWIYFGIGIFVILLLLFLLKPTQKETSNSEILNAIQDVCYIQHSTLNMTNACFDVIGNEHLEIDLLDCENLPHTWSIKSESEQIAFFESFCNATNQLINLHNNCAEMTDVSQINLVDCEI